MCICVSSTGFNLYTQTYTNTSAHGDVPRGKPHHVPSRRQLLGHSQSPVQPPPLGVATRPHPLRMAGSDLSSGFWLAQVTPHVSASKAPWSCFLRSRSLGFSGRGACAMAVGWIVRACVHACVCVHVHMHMCEIHFSRLLFQKDGALHACTSLGCECLSWTFCQTDGCRVALTLSQGTAGEAAGVVTPPVVALTGPQGGWGDSAGWEGSPPVGQRVGAQIGLPFSLLLGLH